MKKQDIKELIRELESAKRKIDAILRKKSHLEDEIIKRKLSEFKNPAELDAVFSILANRNSKMNKGKRGQA